MNSLSSKIDALPKNILPVFRSQKRGLKPQIWKMGENGKMILVHKDETKLDRQCASLPPISATGCDEEDRGKVLMKWIEFLERFRTIICNLSKEFK
jgi:hypothetical protein